VGMCIVGHNRIVSSGVVHGPSFCYRRSGVRCRQKGGAHTVCFGESVKSERSSLIESAGQLERAKGLGAKKMEESRSWVPSASSSGLSSAGSSSSSGAVEGGARTRSPAPEGRGPHARRRHHTKRSVLLRRAACATALLCAGALAPPPLAPARLEALETLETLPYPHILGAAALLPNPEKKVSVKEVVLDSAVMDITWAGHDDKAVLILSQKGRMYRSADGGLQWADITDQVVSSGSSGQIMGSDFSAAGDRPDGPMFERIEVSPADKNVFGLLLSREKT